MSVILFFDPVFPRPYSASDLDEAGRGLGGAEQSVLRLGLALAERHEVWMVQNGRDAPTR